MQKIKTTIITMLLTVLPAAVPAAPIAYSINSDSGSGNADSLYRIDLATGTETLVGKVKSAGETRIDVEGLAFSPEGTLFGVDDSSMTLFPLSVANAQVKSSDEKSISGLPTGGGNDFGMTFACDDGLYLTSIAKLSLYRMDLNGITTLIGKEGSLGVKISALAAFGDPIRLFGLGNGIDGNGQTDSPSLYEIDPVSGIATEIGPLGPAAGAYTEGGLAFDESGRLWAITDRRQLSLPSQVMKINTSTGEASDVRETTETGFESLAVTVPGGCRTPGTGETAEFVVQDTFNDGNDQTPVTLRIQCNNGLPLEQSLTVMPDPDDSGPFEVKFIVELFSDGVMDCEVWQDDTAGYEPDYDCQSNTNCGTNDGEGPCSFEDVGIGDSNLCLIQNNIEPVMLTVIKEWAFNVEEVGLETAATVHLYCNNVLDGDGQQNNGAMEWWWDFEGQSDSHSAMLYPAYDGTTVCHTEEFTSNSAVESWGSCEEDTVINVGDRQRICTVTNTVFLEGIPTLSGYGLLLFSTLILLTGIVAVRRF